MAKGTIGAKIVLEGESQYRAAIKNINVEQKELRSEMKLCQATFSESQNSLEALKQKYEILSKQIDVQTEKTTVYTKAIQDYSDKQEKAEKRIIELRDAIEKAETGINNMTASTEESSEAVDEQKKHLDELRKQLSDAEKNYVSAGQKIDSYKASLNFANADLALMEKELQKTSQYMKEAEQSAYNTAESIDIFGKEVKEAQEETSVFGDVLKANLVSEAIVSGTKALAEGIKQVADSAVELGSSFESSMSQVAATMGMTAEEVAGGSKSYTLLSNAAKECGKTTQYSATEAGEALNYLALAGYDVEKAAATLPKVLNLAAAGGLDLAYASDLVTDSMAAMGMETDKLDTYIDQMAKTSQKSNTSVAQLGEATLVCAGTVSLTGQSLETMNTELGILANNGMKGAEGGTHLRNILLSLSAPTDKAADAMEELGVKVSDSNGNMRNLNDIMVDLNASLDGMSDVKRTQAISKIFNTTDIAAVNALLKGTGEEYSNLYAQISNCSGAAANMAKTLNDNLKGKITTLQSALEGLGIAAYEIFDDTMKEAVDSATDAVGSLQRSIDSGDLGVSLNKMSKALGEFTENAIDIGKDALPVLIDGLTWLIDNADMVIAGVTGITAANIEMKVIAPAVEAVTIAWNTYKNANEGATVSQWLLNTAMNANPAGILITAITGLTAAVAAYVVINKENLIKTDEVTRATKEQAEVSKELNNQYAASKTARTQTREGMEKEAASCKNLVAELKQLQAKTSLTVSEQSRMKMIVEQLNNAIPELNLVLNEQTNKLNMSAEALEDNVEAMMAMARAAAAREDLIRIAEEQYEAEKHLGELEEQLAEQKKAVEEAQKNVNETMKEGAELYAGQTELYAALGISESLYLSQAKTAQQELEEQIRATTESIEGFTSEYEETLNYISDTETIVNASAATQELGTSAEVTGEQLVTMSSEAQEAYSAMYDSLHTTITSQISLFDEFNTKAELSTSELLKNMQSQIDGITEWSDNLKLLAEKGIDQGLLQHLADMGPTGAGYVATFVAMTDEELQKANKLFEESLILPEETIETVAEAYVIAGNNAAEGFVAGITDEEIKARAREEAGLLAQGTLDEMKMVLAIQSPSRETKAIGENLDEGLILGIKEEQPMVLMTVSNLASEIIRTTRNSLQTSVFAGIGRQIPAGLVQGINSGRSDVINAVTSMCTSAVQAAKSALEINSPSKKFDYMGEMSGDGYIGGWKRSMTNINAVIAESLPETTVNRAEYDTDSHWGMDSEIGYAKNYSINQEINIYSKTDDLIEASRKFKEAQREAAEEW